ncbi:MAG TPA: hypothetical protein P5065_05985 [Candidatus Ratteibacteria bacterium]|nr:hypothetical protein [Candidatus Ratteibacteria bacterium]
MECKKKTDVHRLLIARVRQICQESRVDPVRLPVQSIDKNFSMV